MVSGQFHLPSVLPLRQCTYKRKEAWLQNWSRRGRERKNPCLCLESNTVLSARSLNSSESYHTSNCYYRSALNCAEVNCLQLILQPSQSCHQLISEICENFLSQTFHWPQASNFRGKCFHTFSCIIMLKVHALFPALRGWEMQTRRSDRGCVTPLFCCPGYHHFLSAAPS